MNKNYFQDCESGDRKSLSLPFGQDKLIEDILKVNKNVGVILLSGNAVLMPWLDTPPAVLQGWYLGSEAGNALADIISGDVNPSGKLPISFPKKLEDAKAIREGKLKAEDLPDEDRDFFLERRYPAFGNLVPRDVAARAAK